MLVDIEVPRVIGKPVKVAEALLTAAGFVVQTRIADVAVPGAAPESVTEQWPDAGALVQAGSQVVVTYEPRVAGSVDATYVVVIDAGHQAKADVALEPQGPGSKVRKPKVAGGATGVATREPEYARALKISLKLRDVLVSKGVKVVMVRTTNNVDIPNSERALIGNRANADLVVRVHLDSNSIASVNGISTLFPSGNTWVTAIEPRSHVAAAMIETAVVRGTGAASRGVVGRSDMSGFNYSTRPTVIVECGFMSNPAEDRLTAESAYQDKIAAGIAVGVMDFLQTK
jgi:N-acetylmuramoyl-L-alanine amidase